MIISKEDFAKKLEVLSTKFSAGNSEIVKDFTNLIVFLSIYCGNTPIIAENIQLEMSGFDSPKEITIKDLYNKDGSLKKLPLKLEKDNLVDGQKYTLKSYDGEQKVVVVLAPTFIKINKNEGNEINFFYVEYIFDKKGYFIRRAEHKSNPLGKKLELTEESKGILTKGIYFSKIKEKHDEMETVCCKLPNNVDKENIFYSYKSKPDFYFLCRASNKYVKIPTIDSRGMAELNEMLSEQFNDDFLIFNDEKFFNQVLKMSNDHYSNLLEKTKKKEQNKSNNKK